MSDTERDEEVEEIQPPTQSSHDVMEGDIQTDAIVDVSPAFQELAGKLGLGIGSVYLRWVKGRVLSWNKSRSHNVLW